MMQDSLTWDIFLEDTWEHIYDWGKKEKRGVKDEMIGWYHQLNGHECE